MTNASESSSTQSPANANDPSHYMLMTVAIVIGMTGVLLRFFTDWRYISALSNVILVIGVIIALRAVFKILK